MKQPKTGYSSPYEMDGRLPLRIAIPLGMQHVLAMFVSNLTAIIIVANFCGITSGSALQITLLQNAMLVSGLTTLIQLYPIKRVGARLPIVMGTSAGYIGVFMSVAALTGGGVEGYGALMGAFLIGGFVEVFLGCVPKLIKKLLPPVVTGTVLLAVGISLIGIGINSFAGGIGAPDYGSAENLILAFTVLIVTLVLQHFGKGVLRSASILIGVIAGYIVAIIMGLILDPTFMYTDPTTGVVTEMTKSWVLDWQSVADASWLSIPKLMPIQIHFDLRAILPVCLLYFVLTAETRANVTAITTGGLNRGPTDREMSGGLICDGLGSSVAALFGLLPNTSFSQNVGIVTLTKVVNRFCVAVGAIFLILCGFLPKLVAIVSIIPEAVLGGSVAVMFASIMVSGIQILTESKMTARTISIVAVSIGVGYGLGADTAAMSGMPGWINLVFGGSGVATAAAFAVILNLILPKQKEDREAEAELARLEEQQKTAK